MRKEAASGMWRSEEMVKLDVVFQLEDAHTAIFHVGLANCAEFVDANADATAIHRPYAADIRRCDDLERRLRFFNDQISQTSGNIVIAQNTSAPIPLGAIPVERLEVLLEEKEVELRDLNSALEQMMSEMNRCREFAEVLQREIHGISAVKATATTTSQTATTTGLLYVTGVIPQSGLHNFTRMVFRITRGNSVLRIERIEEPFVEATTGAAPVVKSVFVAYASSQRIIDKIRKLAESLGASIYQYTEDCTGSANQLRTQQQSIEDTLSQTQARKMDLLRYIAGSFELWNATVQAEKGTFTMMNLLNFRGPVASGQVWVAEGESDTFHGALDAAARASGSTAKTVVRKADDQSKPPTYFHGSRVIEAFQAIVDSYGIPRYKEVNPGVLTIVTFPYLFGVMFGDIGHGMIIVLIATFLIMFERKFERERLGEIFQMIFGGRYLLFAMGFFAVYMGLLYNDFFGLSLEVFASGYRWPALPLIGTKGHPKGTIYPLRPNGRPIVRPADQVSFGIDVAWTGTENKLEFYNSIKMKCAVIIGVIQMLFGIAFSLMNYLRKDDIRNALFRFIPEFVFLSFTFGYMGFLIIFKWCSSWPNTNLAPSLLETMTDFFLSPGTVKAPMFPGQVGLQLILILVAFASVPVMLFTSPVLEWRASRKKKQVLIGYYPIPASGYNKMHLLKDDVAHATEYTEFTEQNSGDEKEFEFGEVMIHSTIHTIEFVLGTVSNTASYLRLWALSLAHAELSEVFLDFGLVGTLGADSGGGFVFAFGFCLWLCATIGVLVLMEALSAFLHALRLHWVEFQSKFYAGDGTQFTPFNLRELTKLQL